MRLDVSVVTDEAEVGAVQGQYPEFRKRICGALMELVLPEPGEQDPLRELFDAVQEVGSCHCNMVRAGASRSVKPLDGPPVGRRPVGELEGPSVRPRGPVCPEGHDGPEGPVGDPPVDYEDLALENQWLLELLAKAEAKSDRRTQLAEDVSRVANHRRTRIAVLEARVEQLDEIRNTQIKRLEGYAKRIEGLEEELRRYKATMGNHGDLVRGLIKSRDGACERLAAKERVIETLKKQLEQRDRRSDKLQGAIEEARRRLADVRRELG